MNGNCLFWDYILVAFLPPSLEKPFFSNWGGFLAAVLGLVRHALCMLIFSPKLPILVINSFIAIRVWAGTIKLTLVLFELVFTHGGYQFSRTNLNFSHSGNSFCVR
jgi:hypothetical protein